MTPSRSAPSVLGTEAVIFREDGLPEPLRGPFTGPALLWTELSLFYPLGFQIRLELDSGSSSTFNIDFERS